MRLKILVLITVVCSVLPIAAQNDFTMFFEPGINLKYSDSSKFSHNFGLENRNYIYRDSDYQYQLQYLGLAYQTTYSLGDLHKVSFGLKYRFREKFDQANENEFRMYEAFKIKSKSSDWNVNQELRTEQRFYSSLTKHRLRYIVGVNYPLDKVKWKHMAYFKAATEALFEIAKTQKPKLEQRLKGVLGWDIGLNMELETGLQYRLTDYTQNLGHELFLVTGIEIEI